MNANMSGPPRLSWDSERAEAPSRPRFETSIIPEEKAPRPTRVGYAFVLVILASLTFTTLTAIAAIDFESIRASLSSTLTAELRDDYSAEDRSLAVSILLSATWGAMLLLSLIHILSAQSVMLKRSTAARVVLVASILIFLPVATVSASLQGASNLDLAISAVAAAFLCLAAVLVMTPTVTRWLRQSDGPEKQPLIPHDLS